MEHFDILNRDGTRTGKTAAKGMPLENGQYYLGVHAYIVNSKREFLLQQRSYNKEFLPGGWDIHMGHVIAGETSLGAVKREVAEEIGLICEPSAINLFGRFVWEKYHHMIDVYLIKYDFDINMLKLQPEEVIDIKCVAQAEMLDLVNHMDYRPKEYREMVCAAISGP